MGIQRISFDDFEKIAELYKSRSIVELQSIHPRWALDSTSILNESLRPESGEYTFFLADTGTLMRKSEFLEFNPNVLFTGESLNDSRVARILYRWANVLSVDPPVVGIFELRKNKLCFSDGRHRTKTAFLLGNKEIPVAVANEEVENVRRLINLKHISIK